MNQKKRSILLGAGAVILAILVTALMASGSVLAEEGGGRAGKIQSKGIVNYGGGSVVIDTGDLAYLAGEIDTLEQSYKSGMLDALTALNGIGVYLRGDGSVTREKDAQASQPAQPTFRMLTPAITYSQSSAAGIAELSGDTYYKTKDGKLITASSGEDTSGAEEIGLAAATADDLSAGKVAYVDGQLLLGTGEDNRTYYKTAGDTIVQSFANSGTTIRNSNDMSNYRHVIIYAPAGYTYQTHTISVSVDHPSDFWVTPSVTGGGNALDIQTYSSYDRKYSYNGTVTWVRKE